MDEAQRRAEDLRRVGVMHPALIPLVEAARRRLLHHRQQPVGRDRAVEQLREALPFADVIGSHMGYVPYHNPELLFIDGCGLINPPLPLRRDEEVATSRAGHERCVSWARIGPGEADVLGFISLYDHANRRELLRELRQRGDSLRAEVEKEGYYPDFVELDVDGDPTVAFGFRLAADPAAQQAGRAAWEQKLDRLEAR